jgi:hypothetical protein
MLYRTIDEKDIQQLIKRCKDKKDWLNTRDCRSKNMGAEYVRLLMRMAVERELAFDNRLTPESEGYEICFNLDERQKILEQLEDTTKRCLSLEFDDLNRKALIQIRLLLNAFAKKNIDRILPYVILDRYVYLTYEAFSRHQTRGEDINKFFDNALDGIVFKDGFSDRDSKINVGFYKELMILQTEKLIDMYYTLKVGWHEIEHICKLPTYNNFFLGLFTLEITEILELSDPKNIIPITYRNIRKHLPVVSSTAYLIETELEFLISKSSEIETQKYKEILGRYKLDPHGQNFRDALLALAKATNEYPHLKDKIYDLARSSQALYALDGDVPIDSSTAISSIQKILGNSTNPRVRSAVADWRKRGEKIYKPFGKLSRILENNPELRPE